MTYVLTYVVVAGVLLGTVAVATLIRPSAPQELTPSSPCAGEGTPAPEGTDGEPLSNLARNI